MANLFVGKKLIMVKLYVVINSNVVSVFVFYIATGWWGCKKTMKCYMLERLQQLTDIAVTIINL